MSNLLYTEPTKDDLVYFAQRVLQALDTNVPGWSNPRPRINTFPDLAVHAIKRLADARRKLLESMTEAYGAKPVPAEEYGATVASRMVEDQGLTPTGRVPTEPALQPLPHRTTDDGTAHGLRQHSIGSTYPAVVVGSIVNGRTFWHVEFAGLRTHKTPSAKQAQHWAEIVARRYRTSGWDSAVNGLRGAYFYHGPVENRYA